MRPLHLKLTNWRQWRDLDLDISEGVTVLRGLPTAGKSSILYAIDTAVFAPARAGAVLEANRTHGADEVILELICEHAGETYRVRRAQKGRKTTLDFDQRGQAYDEFDHGWMPLTRDTTAATQQLIEETFSQTPAIWRAGTFFARGDTSFVAADRSSRRRLIGEILRLDDPWGMLREKAKTEKRGLERRLVELDTTAAQGDRDQTQRDDHAGALVMMEQNHAEAETALELAENILAKTAADRAHVQAQEAKRTAATALVAERAQTYRSAQGKADALADQIDAARREAGDLPALEELAGMLPALEQAYQSAIERAADQRRREEAHRALAAELVRVSREIDEQTRIAVAAQEGVERLKRQGDEIIRAADPQCPTCQQKIGGEAKKATLVELGEKLDAAADVRDVAEKRVEELHDEQTGLEARVGEALAAIGQVVDVAGHRREAEAARAAAQALAEARARIARADELAVEHDELVQTLPRLAASVQEARNALAALPSAGKLEQLRNAHANAEQAVRTARSTRDTYTAAAERLRGLVDDLDQRLAAAQHAAEEAHETRFELAAVAACERAYAPDGIPALLVESIAVPQLEDEATRILGELDMPYRVELRTQREKADGKGAIEALDLWFCSSTGDVEWDGLSDSERERANLALRFALAQLLERQRGAEHGFLALDEPRHFDDRLYELLAQVLKRMQDTFGTIYVVSHHASLRDAFDQTLEVVKDDAGASRLAEAVLA